VAPLCSITASNWAIAAAFAALAIGHFRYGDPFRFPKVKLPLAVFFLCTTVSIALSGHALEGWEGIRKFYLCLVLLLVASTFRGPSDVRALVLGLSGATAVSAAWSLVQFTRKLGEAQAAGRDFRLTYTAGERITGFMSHWMTLSGEEMMVLLMLAALAMFGSKNGGPRWVLAAYGLLIGVSLAAGYTRSMWLGTALGGAYLIWHKDRRWLFAAPVAAGLLLAINPAGIGGRIVSIWKPAGTVDSNEFRVICRRTALEMIRAHPWFGVGPGQVRKVFEQYIPADIPRPLPPGAYIHMHNVYLQYAAERGIPALLAFLWWIGKMLWDFIRSPNKDWILRGVIAVMIAILAAGWYEHNLGDGEVLTVFLGLCGAGYVQKEMGRE